MPCLLVRHWGTSIGRYEPRMRERRAHPQIHVEIRPSESQVHVHSCLMTLKRRSHGIVHRDRLIRQHFFFNVISPNRHENKKKLKKKTPAQKSFSPGYILLENKEIPAAIRVISRIGKASGLGRFPGRT